jgi:hypothetical protein
MLAHKGPDEKPSPQYLTKSKPENRTLLNLSKYYIAFFLIWIFLFYQWLIVFQKAEILSSVFLLVILLILLFIIFEGFCNLSKIFIYQKKMINRGVEFNFGECITMNYHKSIRTKPLMKNDDLIIEPNPYKSRCYFILTTDYIALFNHIHYFFGMIKINMAPIVIEFRESNTDYLKLKKHRIFKVDESLCDEGILELHLNYKINDLKRFRINNFWSIVKSYNKDILRKPD